MTSFGGVPRGEEIGDFFFISSLFLFFNNMKVSYLIRRRETVSRYLEFLSQ